MTLGGAAAASVRLIVWCGDSRHRVEPDPGEMAARYGAATAVLEWKEQLVCSGCGSRRVDMVVSGTERAIASTTTRRSLSVARPPEARSTHLINRSSSRYRGRQPLRVQMGGTPWPVFRRGWAAAPCRLCPGRQKKKARGDSRLKTTVGCSTDNSRGGTLSARGVVGIGASERLAFLSWACQGAITARSADGTYRLSCWPVG
jgi:hypothetical protein